MRQNGVYALVSLPCSEAALSVGSFLFILLPHVDRRGDVGGLRADHCAECDEWLW